MKVDLRHSAIEAMSPLRPPTVRAWGCFATRNGGPSLGIPAYFYGRESYVYKIHRHIPPDDRRSGTGAVADPLWEWLERWQPRRL